MDLENDLEGYARAVTSHKVTLLSTSGLYPLLSASTNGWRIPIPVSRRLLKSVNTLT